MSPFGGKLTKEKRMLTVCRVLISLIIGIKNARFSDFPGGPIVKTSCFHCRGVGSIPGWGIRSHMSHSAAKKIFFLI